MRKELLLPIVERELAELERFVVRYSMSDKEATTEEYTANFYRLRMYMLVAGPAETGEPGLDEEEKTWLTEHVGDLWTRPMRLSGDPATLSNIEAVAAEYIDMLSLRSELAFDRDTKLVERAQRILKRSDRSKSVAQALVDSCDGPSLRLRDMVAVSSIRNQDRVIRPAFTRRVYEEQVKPRLEGNMDDLLDEQWVLGRMGEDGERLLAEEVEAIKTEYFRRYIIEWRTFIDSIYIDAPDDYVDALGLLGDLTRTEPYKDLFSHIAYHTQLVDLNATEDEDSSDRAARRGEAGRRAQAAAEGEPGAVRGEPEDHEARRQSGRAARARRRHRRGAHADRSRRDVRVPRPRRVRRPQVSRRRRPTSPHRRRRPKACRSTSTRRSSRSCATRCSSGSTIRPSPTSC